MDMDEDVGAKNVKIVHKYFSSLHQFLRIRKGYHPW
jgi:hypothetical protein